MTERTAIVTGGSRGIGRAVCRKLAERSMNIVMNYSANADAAEEACGLKSALRRHADRAEDHRTGRNARHCAESLCCAESRMLALAIARAFFALCRSRQLGKKACYS